MRTDPITWSAEAEGLTARRKAAVVRIRNGTPKRARRSSASWITGRSLTRTLA